MAKVKDKCDLCKRIVESGKMELVYNEIRPDKMINVINYSIKYYACIDCIDDILNFIEDMKGKNYESKT